MGLPSIDESLDKLLVAMETFPNVAVLGDAVGLARIIGLCLALCVGSYECWMMMLGRRGMDVMKLLRIVGISICISCSSWICSALQTPGKGLEAATKENINTALSLIAKEQWTTRNCNICPLRNNPFRRKIRFGYRPVIALRKQYFCNSFSGFSV